MKILKTTHVFATSALVAVSLLNATNGDNLIAVGPNARGMGGISIAAPQDAISAVFGNPAAMCFGDYCPSSQMDVGLTLFMPHVSAAVSDPLGTGNTYAADSDEKIYPIPSIGVSIPFSKDNQEWRFGFAAYGVTGLGVDYRNSAIDITIPELNGAPLVAGGYTSLQIMKVAPALSYQVAPNFSVGVALHGDYATLDMGTGESSGMGYGFQLGALWRPVPNLSIGLSYTNGQEVTHDDVIAQQDPETGNIYKFDLTLEAPQQVGFGIAYEAMDNRLVIAGEAKWINWSDATGYSDFDWEDQKVFAIGFQYEAIRGKLFLRAGYNYGNNPVKEHHDFNGAFTAEGAPLEMVPVQDTAFPRYYYETFRIVGFPAVVEQHITLGFTYEISKTMALNFAYMHALEADVVETGTGPAGAPVTLKSTLSEDSLEAGLAWRF